MKLSEADVNLFFDLMRRLQVDLNRRRRILPGVDSPEAYSKLPQSEAVKIRNALWKHPGAIDTYVAENPDDLPEDSLTIVKRWKRFVSSTFLVVRLLRKHAVFVSKDSQVYAVLALHEPFEDVIFGLPLPVMTTAVLLPYKGKIVYDGFLGLHNITFGGGIRREMHETYMAAKQNGTIVETLEPEETSRTVVRRPGRRKQDCVPLLDDILDKAGKLKGETPFERAAFRLLCASASLARGAAGDPEDEEAMSGAENDLRRALRRWATTRERATE